MWSVQELSVFSLSLVATMSARDTFDPRFNNEVEYNRELRVQERDGWKIKNFPKWDEQRMGWLKAINEAKAARNSCSSLHLQTVLEEEIKSLSRKVTCASCPTCKGMGGVDVHMEKTSELTNYHMGYTRSYTEKSSVYLVCLSCDRQKPAPQSASPGAYRKHDFLEKKKDTFCTWCWGNEDLIFVCGGGGWASDCPKVFCSRCAIDGVPPAGKCFFISFYCSVLNLFNQYCKYSLLFAGTKCGWEEHKLRPNLSSKDLFSKFSKEKERET